MFNFSIITIFYFTITSSFILSYLALPIPDTFFKSSTDLNFPFSVLYWIILDASDGPIPLTDSSSVWVAVFKLTLLVGDFESSTTPFPASSKM